MHKRSDAVANPNTRWHWSWAVRGQLHKNLTYQQRASTATRRGFSCRNGAQEPHAWCARTPRMPRKNLTHAAQEPHAWRA